MVYFEMLSLTSAALSGQWMKEHLNGSFRVFEEKLKQSRPQLDHHWKGTDAAINGDETISVVCLLITYCRTCHMLSC